ncbi:MAG: hypothetical protein GKR88_13385 [Flavobacteriaceae bacterium]|nr:MAG: hypothetical protein GKR88_13345 [Flavobacteriaceae bacterium]QMU65186.1 MAG: hypothetical protein GKR88_13385 [Flavobacteriaceae bacterium]
MKKIILTLVFVMGMTITTMGSIDSNSNLIKQVEVQQVEIESDPDACFQLGGQIFFFLVDNGIHPNQANDIAKAIELVCNILT